LLLAYHHASNKSLIFSCVHDGFHTSPSSYHSQNSGFMYADILPEMQYVETHRKFSFILSQHNSSPCCWKAQFSFNGPGFEIVWEEVCVWLRTQLASQCILYKIKNTCTNMGQDKTFVIKFKIFYFLTSFLKLYMLDLKKSTILTVFYVSLKFYL
jgi:hypothetical protein